MKIDWENQMVTWHVSEKMDIWKELMRLRKKYRLVIPFEVIDLGDGYYGVRFRRDEE